MIPWSYQVYLSSIHSRILRASVRGGSQYFPAGGGREDNWIIADEARRNLCYSSGIVLQRIRSFLCENHAQIRVEGGKEYILESQKDYKVPATPPIFSGKGTSP